MTTATRTNQTGFTRGQSFLLAVLVAVTVAVYGMLAVALVKERVAPMPVVQASAASGSLTLDRARSVATDLAVGSRADAYLVGATATWRLAGGDRLTLYRPAWAFRFYSPSAHRVQVVTVDQDGGRVERSVPVHTPPQRVDADWSLGAGDLLLIWMAHGGEEFMRDNAHVNIHCQLTAEGGRPIWQVIALDPATRRSLVVRIDALTRQVEPGDVSGEHGSDR